MDETFTIDELLDVLVGASQSTQDTPPGALTMKQLQQHFPGRSVTYIAKMLRLQIESGRVECVRVPFRRIDGARTTVPAYRLVGGWGEDDNLNSSE